MRRSLAARNDEGHDRAAVQAEHAKDPVQHICDPRKIAGVLQQRDVEEHEHDQRGEPEHPADAVDDAGFQKRFEQPVAHVGLGLTAQPFENSLHPGDRRVAQAESEVVQRLVLTSCLRFN